MFMLFTQQNWITSLYVKFLVSFNTILDKYCTKWTQVIIRFINKIIKNSNHLNYIKSKKLKIYGS